jgi:hypothetical protein
VRRRAAALVGGAAALLAVGCGAPAPAGVPAPGGTVAAAGPAAPSSPAVVPIDLRVLGGQVQGGPGARVEVPLGATVRIAVTSDRADELHLHGYDRTLPLAAGTPGVLEVVADVPGVFETELHHSGVRLPSLEVR